MTEVPETLKKSLAGHYDLEREIGRGGMATVYLANDVKHGRNVAVKVLRPDLAASLERIGFSVKSRSPPGYSTPTS